MHELSALRAPLVFGRAHANITLFANGALATQSVTEDWRAAASTVVMRSGRHFARFTVVKGCPVFGVIRPGWDVEGGGTAFRDRDTQTAKTWPKRKTPCTVNGHCFYATYNGRRYPGSGEWEGSQSATEQGDRVGMLLDLDQGSMTVWKNDEKLGVMVAEGLSGPLCWAVTLRVEGGSTRIESTLAPPSPTEEELAAAKARQRRELLNLPETATDAECAGAEDALEDEFAAMEAEIALEDELAAASAPPRRRGGWCCSAPQRD
jgi:hypothetical protein